MNGTWVAWSPQGRLIVASYYDAGSDEIGTAVIDATSGHVVSRYELQACIGSPNGSWLDEHRLVLTTDATDEPLPPLYLVDVRTGETRRLTRSLRCRYCLAIIDGRLLGGSDDIGLYLSTLDGDVLEPFVQMTEPDIATFDLAPAATGTTG